MSNKSERQSGLTAPDSIVKRMVGAAQARQEKERGQDGRGQPGHAGRKGIDRRGVSKKTVYLDLDTQALIEQMSQAENVPQADIIAAGVLLLSQAIERGLDLDALKIIVYSDKQTWRSTTRLELSSETKLFSAIPQHKAV